MTNQPANTAAIKALCKAQAAMPKAEKDSNNPHFGKKYESLAAVQDAALPHLHANGFAVLAPTGRDENGDYLETILMHESGHSFSCRVPLIVDKNSMQGFKSAVTYARRIGLSCLSSVAPEDDDGNSAAANPPKRGNGRGKVVDDTPPHEGNPFDDDPGRADDIAAREIAKMQTINDMEEFKSYWGALAEMQPLMARRPDVQAAKDAQKLAIAGKEAA